ncbi:MAG: KH domain-containing protein [Acidobacteriota bacterium]
MSHQNEGPSGPDLKALVEVVARALADRPDAVRVGQSERRGGLVLELHVAPGDLGRVIGRQGRTAAAIRTLLAAAAEADGRRVSLDIRDA